MKRAIVLIVLVALCLILVTGCSSSASSTATTSSSSSTTGNSSSTVADGKTLLDTRCTTCHSLAQVANRKGTSDQWKAVVDQMIQRGAVLSADEETVLVQYLAANFK